MLEKYMKHSHKLQKMQKKLENVRKKYLLKYIVKKLQEMQENVRKIYENLR